MIRTVAVTGATGFIGHHIVEKLLSRGFAVRGLTRQAYPSSDDNLIWIRGNLDDRVALAELVREADCVIHCAGQVRGSREEIFTHCNVSGSLRLMQAVQAGGKCQRFLFISSLAARYPQLSWYANSKFLAEQKLTAMADDISLGIFRPTAVYGPGDKELKPVFNWLLRGILPCLGSPEARLSFLHVSDLAEAVYQWLIVNATEAMPMELCDGVAGGYSWQRLQEMASRIRGKPVHLIGIPLPLLKLAADIGTLSHRLTRKEPMLTRSKIRELTHSDWSASNFRLSQYIDWRPEVSVDRALRERLF
ncbi:NAD-dependent epimerase/dehydratase family protein [Erwiniaceae bacterium CAU 1747]